MAVEKDKVLAAIELKFKGKSITKTFKENIAAKWAAKIDNDTEIDTYIEDREDVILEAVSEADRRATDAVKKATEKKTELNPEPEPVDEFKDAPEWFKAYTKANEKRLEEIAGEVTGFKTAQQTKSIEERFKSDERLKDIPAFMFKGRTPKTEEEYETYATDLAADFTNFAKEAKITTFGKDAPPSGTHQKGASKEASKEDIDRIAAKINI